MSLSDAEKDGLQPPDQPVALPVTPDQENALARLASEASEEALWDVVVQFQGFPFQTLRGLPFTYQLKVGRNGTLNRELLVSRRKESKSLAWSSVRLAFEKAKALQGAAIRRPKDIGDIRGISYIYAMFVQWGLVAEIADRKERA